MTEKCDIAHKTIDSDAIIEERARQFNQFVVQKLFKNKAWTQQLWQSYGRWCTIANIIASRQRTSRACGCKLP